MSNIILPPHSGGGGVSSTLYPVGTIYQTTDSSFSPSDAWGGTWELIVGRVVIGVDTSNQNLNTSGKTGGSQTHNHPYAIEYPLNYSQIGGWESGHETGLTVVNWDDDSIGTKYIKEPVSKSHSFNQQVQSSQQLIDCAIVNVSARTGSENGLPPYFTAYIWHRIA